MSRWMLLGAATLSWAGFVAHNLADLPGQTLLSPETLYPTIVTAALAGGWLLTGWRSIGWTLLAWALLHLVGGALISILPLPILPFDPEQSVRHYAFHVVYGVTQLPLVALLHQRLRRSAATPR